MKKSLQIFTAAENVANSLGIKITRPWISQTSKYSRNSGGADISIKGHYGLDVTRVMTNINSNGY